MIGAGGRRHHTRLGTSVEGVLGWAAVDVQQSRARRRAREQRRRRRRRRGSALLVILVGGVAVAVQIAGSHDGDRGPVAGARTSVSTTTTTPPRSRVRERVRDRPQHATSAPSGRDPPADTPVPILMYHVIASAPAGAPFPGLYVPAPEFAQQMRALKTAGWHAITLDQAVAHWQRGVRIGPGRPIVLSFDNGYRTQYTHALPVLRALGWVGVENLQLTGLPPAEGGLTRAQIRGLVDAGWELDTQGLSHADLVALDATALHAQVVAARTTIRRRFGVDAHWFCYPSGHYDPTVIAAVKRAGFVGATTVAPGWARRTDDPYRLPRLRVLGGTTGPALLRLIDNTRRNPPPPASYEGAAQPRGRS
jgi:peptidoglycan/xylan/chitin deacetylase (PgdA/CDA1 family)